MYYLIFNSLKDANQFIESINQQMLKEWSKRKTYQYADVLVHPSNKLFAVIVDEKYLKQFSFEVLPNITKLDSSWVPERKQ